MMILLYFLVAAIFSQNVYARQIDFNIIGCVDNVQDSPTIPVSALAKKRDSSDSASIIMNIANFNKVNVNFQVIKKEGPDHSPLFTMQLTLNQESYTATGKSLKAAKQNVSSIAVAHTKYEHPPKLRNNDASTPISELNNLGLIHGFKVDYFLVDKRFAFNIPLVGNALPRNLTGLTIDMANFLRQYDDIKVGPFNVMVKIGDTFEFTAKEITIQLARHKAAEKALNNIDDILGMLSCYAKDAAGSCAEQRAILKSPVSRINEYANRAGSNVNFQVIDEIGPAHKKIFVTRCDLNGQTAEGQASTKKKSKQQCAESLLKIVDQRSVLPHGIEQKTPAQKKQSQTSNSYSFSSGLNNVVSLVQHTLEKDKEFHSDDNDKRTPSNAKSELIKVLELLNIQWGLQHKNVRENNVRSAFVMEGISKQTVVCVGEGWTEAASENNAALLTLKFLYKKGILHTFVDNEHCDGCNINDDSISIEENLSIIVRNIEQKKV